MKKTLTLFASLAIIGFISSNDIQATTNSNSISTSSEISPSATTSTITVYMIKQSGSGSIWIKSQKKGIYDSDDNTIRIDGDTYSIRTNSYSGGGRERYDYQAGGIYFFNL